MGQAPPEDWRLAMMQGILGGNQSFQGGGYNPYMQGGGYNPYMQGGGYQGGGYQGGGYQGGGYNPYMQGGGYNPYMQGGGYPTNRRMNRRNKRRRRTWKDFREGWKNRDQQSEDPVETVPVSLPVAAPVSASGEVSMKGPAGPAGPTGIEIPSPVTDSASLSEPTPTMSTSRGHVISRRALTNGVPVPKDLQNRIDKANKESYLSGGIANLHKDNINQDYTGGRFGNSPTPAAPPSNPFAKNYTDAYKAQLATKV
jgi:hypothetical protein